MERLNMVKILKLDDQLGKNRHIAGGGAHQGLILPTSSQCEKRKLQQLVKQAGKTIVKGRFEISIPFISFAYAHTKYAIQHFPFYEAAGKSLSDTGPNNPIFQGLPKRDAQSFLI